MIMNNLRDEIIAWTVSTIATIIAVGLCIVATRLLMGQWPDEIGMIFGIVLMALPIAIFVVYGMEWVGNHLD